ncbi:response regulator transcription factor [Flavobacterium sp. N502536]|uniref:response regulator transcription factor n=1 Tax=Flavobacterium sp. N502536 TaxID=2986837 RepID=UPI0029CAC343|nr:LuxR C-terminal-related transcriptional regulator [Flavobacterium sp. N502536]
MRRRKYNRSHRNRLSGTGIFLRFGKRKIFNIFSHNNPKLNKNIQVENPILSAREVEIITLIALEYSGKEISEQLFISTNTVETHRKNIMKKLQIKSTIGLVKYALKNNLINS